MMPLLLATATLDSITASVHGLLPSGVVSLGDAALRALLVAGVVGAGLRIMAARHVPAQKAAWGLVLGGAVLMPILAPWAGKASWVPEGATWVVPAHRWGNYLLSQAASQGAERHPLQEVRAARAFRSVHAVQPVAGAVVSAQPEEAGRASTGQARFQIPTVSNEQAPAVGVAHPAPHRTYYLPISDVVWIIYGSVCLALLLRLAYGLGGAIGLWQSAEPVVIDSHLADGLHLRFSRKINSPVTIGSGVVLPADYSEWDTEKLRIVLAHERSHVRQGDFYLQALAGVYTALFWFSPLGWWLKSKLSELSETISDHAGLEQAESHATYARILLEFAALPRRAPVGVAMARAGGIAQRIERLLNEKNFRQAFTGGRRRLMAALLLVPISLFAATALIRVQAAQTLKHPVSDQGPVILQSHPEPAVAEAAAQAATAAVVADAEQQAPPAQTPPPDEADAAQAQEPAPPATPPIQDTPAPAAAPAPAAGPTPAAAPRATPAPPPPPDDSEDADQDVTTTTTNQCNNRSSSFTSSHSSTRSHGYSYGYSSDGDSYALVTGGGWNQKRFNFSGDWGGENRDQINKARAMAHGDFLWFSRDGKSYVVDDPRTIAHIQSMYKPMEELGERQRELGEKQRELGDQQRELGARQREAAIPTPDLSKEMADLNASITRLQAQKGGTITGEQLSEIQRNIGELQNKIGHLHGEIGASQRELGSQQGELGRLQGELGRRQGELGREQGRIAREANLKVQSIIDQALRDGRARPVQ